MGSFTNFLKICGFWFGDKGTVFGGPEGDGILGKIVFIAPLKPPQPPAAHGQGQAGHYPAYISEPMNHSEYSRGFRNLEPYRMRFAYGY